MAEQIPDWAKTSAEEVPDWARTPVETVPDWAKEPVPKVGADEYAMPEYEPPKAVLGSPALGRITAAAKAYAREQAARPPAMGIGQAGLGLGEAALSMGRGLLGSALGGLRGIANLAMGESPDVAAEKVQSTQEAWAYQPRTAAGKLTTEVAGAPLALAAELGGKVGGAIGGLAGEKGRVAGEAIGQFLPEAAATVLPAKAALRAARTPKTVIPPKTPTEAINIKGQQLGYSLPPSDVAPTIGKRVVTGLGGIRQFEQQSSLKNQPVTNRLINEQLGVPKDVALTKDILQDVRDEALDNYRNLAKADYGTVMETKPPAYVTEWGTIGEETARPSGVRPNQKFLDKIDSLANQFSQLKRDYPALVKGGDFKRIVADLKKEHDPATALNLIQDLRNQATHNFKGTDVPYSRKRLASFQRKTADALEQLFEDNLKETGNEALVKSFRDARQKIAQTYAVEKALNETTGNIDANMLARELKRGKPLTGRLKDVAEFASAHGKLMQMPERMGTKPGFSPVDIGAGVLEAAALAATGHPVAALSAGLVPFVRPGLRSAALSDYYQKRGGSAVRTDTRARRAALAKTGALPAAAGAEAAQEEERQRTLAEGLQ